MTLKTRSSSKWGMLLGNLFEHYDTALFNLLAPFFATLFFPEQNAITALVLTYAIIPLGMFIRPFGAIFFGYIGDSKGRKVALVISLQGMACVTACMGFIPTYEYAGFFAPLLLSLFRVLQNFFASGENVGGAIYLMEQESDNQQDLISGLYNSSTIGGILLASFGVSLLYLTGTIHTYWRFLYFFGSVTAVVAHFLRANTHHAYTNETLPFRHLLKSCFEHRKIVFTIAVAAGFSYTCYTTALVMINGLVPLISPVTKEEMMHLTTFLLIIDFLMLPLFGLLAKRYSREKMMILAGIAAASSGLFLFNLLDQATILTVIFVRFILVLIGTLFSAPFYAWAQNLVPTHYRYTFISFGYAIGTQLFGAPSAAISIWLFQSTKLITSAAWYWMGLGLLASYLVFRQLISREEELVYQEIPYD